MSGIYKAYDVRGIFPDEINENEAYKAGFAFANFIKSKNKNSDKIRLAVGNDARTSSPVLRNGVVRGMTDAGADVIDVHDTTTPLFYFSVVKLQVDGGVMVTASHNPPQYGGLKFVGKNSVPIGKETGLLDIEKMSQSSLQPELNKGGVSDANFISEYIDFAIKNSKINFEKVKNMRIVVDAGNGMTPILLRPLFEKIHLSYQPLFFDIDGNFPNRPSDVSKIESLSKISEEIKKNRADLGVAFDGDGDRIAFIDENGKKIDSGFILSLISMDRSGMFFKPKTVYDLRFSRSVKEFLGRRGIVSRVGHSFIKKLMADKNADIGGEISGHFFFKEANNAESSILTMLIVMKIISEKGEKISEIVKPFDKYFYSGEINIELSGEIKGEDVLKKLEEKYNDGKHDKLDGLTVEYNDWWFNARLSNTEPLLRLVTEAKTKELMEQRLEELENLIKNPA